MSFRLRKLVDGINSNDTGDIEDIEHWLYEKGSIKKILDNKEDVKRCLKIIENIGFKLDRCFDYRPPYYVFSGEKPFKKVSLKLREASWRSVQKGLMRYYTLKTYCPSIGGEDPRGIREKRPHYTYRKIRNTLNRHNIRFLYHCTDKSNISSIRKEGGICSKKYLSENGIDVKKSASTKESRMGDKNRSLYDYVYLSYVPMHPMMLAAVREGRIEEPAILRIDRKQAFREGTLFCSGNSDSPYTSISFTLNKHMRYEYDLIREVLKKQEEGERGYEHKRGKDKYHAIQSEVIVRRFVPKESILNLPSPMPPPCRPVF